MDRKLSKNIITGFGGQFIIIILGIIIPRIMITNYGSDTNGLLTTIVQIFSYLNLLEAGIAQAAKNELYKPIVEKDQEKIIYYASVARHYFRTITIYYFLIVLAFAAVSPYVIKTSLSYRTVFLIVVLEGMSQVVSFFFIQTQTTVLVADGRGYVNNGVNLANKICSYMAKIVLALLGINIVFLEVVYFLITVCKVFFYNSYFKKHYPWLVYKKVPSTEKLENRNAFILTELSSTVFSSTDLIVLSTFFSTQLSSVYMINSMAFSQLNMLVNSVYSSINYLLGQTFHEGIKKYEKVHDACMSVFVGIITVLMSVAYTLCIPFVKLYTAGVTDINYVYKSLPFMFCLIQILSWSRYVQGYLTGVAGYAKQVSKISLIEASMNIVLSFSLAWKFGIIGVTAATVISLPIKVLYCTYISDKLILKRSYARTCSILGVNYLFFAFVVITTNMYELHIPSYKVFFLYGIIYVIVYGTIGMGMNIFVNRDCLTLIKQIMNKLRKKK